MVLSLKLRMGEAKEIEMSFSLYCPHLKLTCYFAANLKTYFFKKDVKDLYTMST